MAAYYNEIDPFAAAWLRNLIKGGHIADGEVDERDIRDVSPTDLVRFDQCHFFAGIGGWSRALRLAGIPDDAKVWTGSCPCQPFSAAGSGGGFADERHLWPSWFHLIDVVRPAKIYGEQVASPDALEWFDLVFADLETAGYSVGSADLCAAGLGAPHIRQRLWFVADAASEQCGTRREHSTRDEPGTVERSSRFCFDGGMADPTCERLGTARECGAERKDAEQCGGTFGMGHALESGLEGLAGNGNGTARREIAPRSTAEAGDAFGMADAEKCGRREKCPDGLGDGFGNRAQGVAAGPLSSGADSRPAPTNGFWRAADWLFCRDGKWRPVEPGTFPLAHGIPGRVGRLRAYGNAICPPVAAAFVRATL